MGTQSDFLIGLAGSVGNVDFEIIDQTEVPRVYNFFRYREDLASFATWLFVIARRLAADHFRKQ